MKIAVVFDQVPRAGGAFHQSINAVEQFKRVCGDSFDLHLFHMGEGGDLWLSEVGLTSTMLRETWLSKLVELMLRLAPRPLSRRLKLISPREKFLLSRGIDLAYFVSPNPLALHLRKLKYFLTLYDLCHRDFPEFPEVSDFVNFESRDSFNWMALPKAALVIVDSDLLKSLACRIYGLQEDRVLVMPYGVSHYILQASSDGAALRAKYGLKRPFLFYPAQFWAHKNHVRILQALHALKGRGREVDVAFSGSDKGERAHVEAVAARLGLVDQVHFLGFVPSEDLAGLYSEAIALVMPTNIPPLEAWARKTPVIYSQHLSVGIEDGVLAIDCDAAESIAGAIEEVTQESVRERLIAGGRRCLERVQQRIAIGEEMLREHLIRFARRRESWTPYQTEVHAADDARMERDGAAVPLNDGAVQ
jgi:glycosyltransferase involved in cell wall biosynthesis